MPRFENLVAFWNLRTCDWPVWFVDPSYPERYIKFIPAYAKYLKEEYGREFPEDNMSVRLWSRVEKQPNEVSIFDKIKTHRCIIGDDIKPYSYLRLTVKHIGESSTKCRPIISRYLDVLPIWW